MSTAAQHGHVAIRQVTEIGTATCEGGHLPAAVWQFGPLPGAVAGKVHFDGLNALRFFAALSVVLWHVELTKSYLHIPNAATVFDRINCGGLGVVLFFVLSGFLITYLLCVEKCSQRRISLRDFYIRRILKIWPL